MAPIKVIENFVAKKRRKNVGMNRKAAWRKHVDLTDVERCLVDQEEEDRLGVLGAKTENLLFLDHDPDWTSEKGDSAEVPLEYTIDLGSGLKNTGRKIEEKIIKAHNFLNGLPGKAAIIKERSRFREEHTKLFKDKKIQAKLAKNKKYCEKQAKKELINKVTQKESKAVTNLSKKRRTDTDAWAVKELDQSGEFIKDAMAYTMEMMKKRPIRRQMPKAEPKKIAAVPKPHAGLSYNPSLGAHQELLQQAAHQETRKVEKLKAEALAKGDNFPLGALKANIVQTLEDMEPQDQLTDVKEVVAEAAAEEVVVSRPGRTTKKERLDKKRGIWKQAGKRQKQQKQDIMDDFDKIEEFTKEIKKREKIVKFRNKVRKIKIERRKSIPARYFKDPGMEAVLPEDLSGTLRTMQPSSNATETTFQHIYRRGLLPNKAKKHNKVGRSALRLPKTRNLRAKQLDAFTPDQFFGIKEAQNLLRNSK